MIQIDGLKGITASIIAHSISPDGQEILTYQLHYPRIIHSEFMTHRMLSKNASSSRAIPVNKIMEYISSNTAEPVEWGKNQAGMQADGTHDGLISFEADDGEILTDFTPEEAWEYACNSALAISKGFADAGYHKQIANRLTEPFQFINVVTTGTDWNNFFYLRHHSDADPTIAELARIMYECYKESTPELLLSGEYHTPYVEHERGNGGIIHYVSNGDRLKLEDAIKVSISCCAQVSYRNNDNSLEKALTLYDRLVTMKPAHASPTEHVATPFNDVELNIRKGLLEVSKDAKLDLPQIMYSGNFCGFTQFRKTIKDENFLGKFVK